MKLSRLHSKIQINDDRLQKFQRVPTMMYGKQSHCGLLVTLPVQATEWTARTHQYTS